MLPCDLQVNGYGGVDFNSDTLTAAQMELACAQLVADGVGQFLATVITDHVPVMCARLARLAAYYGELPHIQDCLIGLHVEGPFLNPADGYRGAHPRDAILPADVSSMEQLLVAGNGLVRLVTLAPEADDQLRVTRFLAERNVCVAAGHTDASRAQLRAAAAAGCTLFTHLGNGCPALLPRHDNIIQRVLALREHFLVTLIADGAHVPFFVLENYLRLIGIDRAIVVSDAIAPAGLGPGDYTLGRWQLRIGPDLVARSPDGGHLVGSAVGLTLAAKRLSTETSLEPGDILRLTTLNPRSVLDPR